MAQHKEALQRVMPVGLVYGNASKDDARRIWKTVSGRWGCRGRGPEGQRAGVGREEGERDKEDATTTDMTVF